MSALCLNEKVWYNYPLEMRLRYVVRYMGEDLTGTVKIDYGFK